LLIEFKAVYPNGTVQTNDVSVLVQESIPDPVFTLTASTNLWDGRQTLTVVRTSRIGALAGGRRHQFELPLDRGASP